MKLFFKLIDISDIKRISFRQDITGLRAIAVLAVVFYHAEIELFKGGWLGVDIFFVISGYLISNIIISELNEGTFTFKNFYLRRVRRILPALFSMLLLTIPFGYFLLTPKAIEEYVNSMIGSVFFYANYYFQNLKIFNEKLDNKYIMDSLTTLNLESLKDDLDNILGQGGINLSSGQKQKLNFIRSYLKPSQLLILDEPTSNLDFESEDVLKNYITERFSK